VVLEVVLVVVLDAEEGGLDTTLPHQHPDVQMMDLG
jgi:hypothetical protein